MPIDRPLKVLWFSTLSKFTQSKKDFITLGHFVFKTNGDMIAMLSGNNVITVATTTVTTVNGNISDNEIAYTGYINN